MNNISFKAQFIKTAMIREAVDKTCKGYRVVPATIVELDTSNAADMRVLNKVANNYQKYILSINDYNYANDIRDKFNKLYSVPERKKNENFYLLTNENVEETGEISSLNPDNVLGVAQVNDNPNKKECELKFLQVDPKTNYRAKTRLYKDAGKALLKGIEDIFKKSVILTYDNNALGFYIKHGYDGYSDDTDKLIHEYKG